MPAASNSFRIADNKNFPSKYPEIGRQQHVVSEDSRNVLGMEKPAPSQILASNMTYSAQRHVKNHSINNMDLTNRSPETHALSTNTIEDLYSAPGGVNSNPSQNVSTIEEKQSPALMPLTSNYNVSRTLKRGCRHLMKHVETDHMQRKGMSKYGAKLQQDAFSPKVPSVLSAKPLSQHPLTQAFLKKQ